MSQENTTRGELTIGGLSHYGTMTTDLTPEGITVHRFTSIRRRYASGTTLPAPYRKGGTVMLETIPHTVLEVTEYTDAQSWVAVFIPATH